METEIVQSPTTSARRIAANRQNAKKSTGPRTPAGKRRVARNALQHGWYSKAKAWTQPF